MMAEAVVMLRSWTLVWRRGVWVARQGQCGDTQLRRFSCFGNCYELNIEQTLKVCASGLRYDVSWLLVEREVCGSLSNCFRPRRAHAVVHLDFHASSLHPEKLPVQTPKNPTSLLPLSTTNRVLHSPAKYKSSPFAE